MAAGTYNVTVSLGSSCSAIQSIVVPNTATGPTVSSTTTSATCGAANGGATITPAGGGGAPYNYIWDPTGNTTNSISNVSSGSYVVTVTSSNGCSAVSVVNISSNNATINITGTTTPNSACTVGVGNGAINITAIPANPNYTYNWSSSQTTQNINNLLPGSYTVTVSIGNCQNVASFNITNVPILPSLSPSSTATNCGQPTGSVSVIATGGGGGPYSYAWATFLDPNTVLGNNATLSNLSANTYIVTVSGSNGCSSTVGVPIANNNVSLTLNATVTPVTNCNSPNGIILLNVSPPGSYTYTWSPSGSGNILTDLAEGDYNVTVASIGSCVTTGSYHIYEIPARPNINVTTVPASCGLDNGSATAVGSSGVGPYTFNWEPVGLTGATINMQPAGTYQVTVTGFNGCINETTVTIPNVDPAINITGTTTANSNCAASNGTVNITVTPSNQSYEYQWSNSETTQDINGLTSGTYIVTVTLSGGGSCSSTASFFVAPSATDPNLDAVVTPSPCGQVVGAINLTVTGATMPYTYLWESGETTQDLTNLAPNTYTVTVTGANSCSAVGTYIVDGGGLMPQVIGDITTTSCGLNNGAIDLTVSNGQAPYTYLWGSGITTQDRLNIASGTYNVTVTGANACSTSASFIVPNGGPTMSIVPTINPAFCGQSNGGVNIAILNGQSPYSFMWSNSTTEEDLSGVGVGVYSVTVTDDIGCTRTSSFTVTPSGNAPTVVYTVTPAACEQANGEIDITVTGGAMPYTYLWSNSTETTQDISNLASGSYTVTVTDNNNCTVITTIDVTVDGSVPDAVITTLPVNGEVCDGASITLNASGAGVGGMYDWLHEVGVTNNATVSVTPIAPSTDYSVVAITSAGCRDTAVVTITVNTLPLPTITISPLQNCNQLPMVVVQGANDANYTNYNWSSPPGGSASSIIVNTNGTYTVTVTDENSCTATTSVNAVITTPVSLACSQLNGEMTIGACDGAARLTITAGSAPYTYHITGPNSFILDNVFNTDGQHTINALCCGSYQVTITDANGCSDDCIFSISCANCNLSANSVVSSPLSCNGDSNGAISVSLIGGTAPFNYSYDDILGTTQSGTSATNTFIINNLPAGDYTITIDDAAACQVITSVTITEPPLLIATGVNTNASCFGYCDGSIDITVNGNITPVTYTWSNSAWNGNAAPTNVCVGTYTVTVSQNSTCSSTVSLTVTEPPQVDITCSVVQNVSTTGNNDGIGRVTVNTGVAPFAINWAGADFGSLLNQSSSPIDISNLVSGNYSVTVTDANGCTATCNFIINDGNCTMTLNITKTDNLCFGDCNGIIDVTVNNAIGGVTAYTWSNASTGNVEDPSNLCAGSYTVTVTDGANCTASVMTTISQPISAVNINCVSQTNANIGMSDGTSTINLSGGTAPYGINWAGTSTGSLTNLSTGNTTITNLSGGAYSVTITDANGCTDICIFNITQLGCTYVVGTMSGTVQSLCETGCITAIYNNAGQNTTGGILQYILHTGNSNIIQGELGRNSAPTFCYDANTMTYGTMYYISAVVGNDDGTSNVDLTDGCTVVSSGSPVVWYANPTASIAAPANLNCDITDITLTASSDAANASYQWGTNGGGVIVGNTTQANVTATAEGNYNVTVTGIGSCTATASTFVQDDAYNPLAFITATPSNVLDCTLSSTGIQLSGTSSISNNAAYAWMQGANIIAAATSISVTQPGLYTLMVVDTITGCEASEDINITDGIAYPPLEVATPASLNCAVTAINLTGGSQFQNITFAWVTPEGDTMSGATLSNISQQGVYTFIGTDTNNGCTNDTTVIVAAPNLTPPTANAGVNTDLDCDATAIQLTGSGSGGTALTYSWTSPTGGIITNPTTATPMINQTGVYVLTVQNLSNFCIDTDSVEVGQTTTFAGELLTSDPSCYGDDNGLIVAIVDGVRPPYNFQLNGTDYGSSNLFSYLEAGNYNISVTDGAGCIWETTYNLNTPLPTQIALGPDLQLISGDVTTVQAQINVTPSMIDTIIWSPADWFNCTDDPCFEQVFTPVQNGYIDITVIDTNGCVATDRILVVVEKRGDIYIPNAFTPNNDGFNDILTIFGSEEVKQVLKFRIFDRWGTLVFANDKFDPNNEEYGWDGNFKGEPMNPAVFVYWAEVELEDGVVVFVKGDITLIR
ncbi:MAG: T9SS type B sorting domain-containing protein [Saprospiraceae bacterium]